MDSSYNNVVVPFARKSRLRAANLVMLRTLDPDAERPVWELVAPAAVPEFIRLPRTIAKLVDGCMAQNEATDDEGELVDPYWYRAEQLTQAVDG